MPDGFRGVDCVLGTVEGLKKFIEIQPSPYHGLNFCQGTISESLVGKLRSELGLTGPPRPGARDTESAESAGRSAAPATRRGTGPKQGGGRPPAQGDERPVPQETASEAEPQEAGSQSGGADRTRVLTRLEGQIDELLFAIKVAGGLPEFEETLRRARRILARSHGD